MPLRSREEASPAISVPWGFLDLNLVPGPEKGPPSAPILHGVSLHRRGLGGGMLLAPWSLSVPHPKPARVSAVRLTRTCAPMAVQDGFDSLQRTPKGSFAGRGGLQEVNFRVLTPFQRALLTIDGTVTQFIEAYTMEPVEILCLRQGESAACEEHRWLEPEAERAIMEREVLIRGSYTGTLYVYAISHLLSGRLPPRVRERLEVQGQGIGRVFQDEKLETRREVLWFGRERMDSLPFALRDDEDAEFISRAYRIILQGRPVVMINERFPVSLGRTPAHH